MAKFEKGQSGNPAGRPVGSLSLTTLLKKALQERPEDAQAVVAKIIKDAIEGDVAARKLILDRVDGAIQQAIDHTTGGQPLGKVLLGISVEEDI